MNGVQLLIHGSAKIAFNQPAFHKELTFNLLKW